MRQRAWRQLLDEQHGVVTTAQARAAGMTTPELRSRVARGEWTRLLRGVYSVTSGTLTRAQGLWAALLAGGPDAVLSHATAAEIWEFEKWKRPNPDSPIHVTRPGNRAGTGPEERETPPPSTGAIRRERDETPHPGIVIHRSRALDHTRTWRDGWPVTSRTDTAIDLAVGKSTAREAYGELLRQAVRSGVTGDQIAARLELRRPHRYGTTLAAAAEMLRSGVTSALEAEFVLRVEIPYRLPSPTRQVPVFVDGTILYEDVVYEAAGTRLTVRLDGRRFHEAAHVRFRDRRRDNATELRGEARLVYGWEDVTGDPGGVAGEILAVLGRLGLGPRSA